MRRMDCSEVCDLLAAYHDDELPAHERRAMADHLAECDGCSAHLARLVALRDRLRAAGTFAPPPELAHRVAARLGGIDRTASTRRRRLALVASHIAAAALGALVLYAATARFAITGDVMREALAAHTRAMIGDQLVEVASADTHTVRPWFATRVPFSPPVRNFAPDDFPLLGGRIDQIFAKPAAVAVYARRKHRIAVFAQPNEATELPASLAQAQNGYSMLSWREGDFTYLAISDLNATELQDFADRWRRSPQ